MLSKSAAKLHPFLKTSTAAPWDAPDPVPVMRREMKLLLIELNLLRVEVEQLRAGIQAAHATEQALTASVARLMASRDHWHREAERLSGSMPGVSPWSLFWWRCRGLAGENSAAAAHT
jgi:hypothetical protein